MTRTLLVGSGQFLDALGDGLRALGHDVTASDVGGLIGTADLVVHVPKVPNGPTDLVNLTPDNWVAACEAPLDEAVAVARAAHPMLARQSADDGPGRLAWIIPTTALGGAAGFVATGAACEGIRALAKGAAKQWGADRVVTTVLVVAPEAFFAGATGPRSEGSLSGPALGRHGDPGSDLAPLLDLLADPRAAFTTGGTLVADGGTWMAP
ncbi:MAG: SDR family oxidoreductase [Actinomycetota bacterium]|nr:SDR family oxidoreductase [Actinomycetota bacterium]MED6327486.1 SDR family oxidoreductase [Actinomycetota bacterium]MEE2958704.1 SDR family oxidoreductase [Actinomycetota bacterium]